MLAKMNNWHGWVKETRADVLYSKYKEILTECGFCIKGECTYIFTPQGFTALFLLSESHFAIHTFPEENKTYLELSSCVDKPFERWLEYVEQEETQDGIDERR
jgi:S-adenosylmethionine decarboxylase